MSIIATFKDIGAHVLPVVIVYLATVPSVLQHEVFAVTKCVLHDIFHVLTVAGYNCFNEIGAGTRCT